MIKKILNIISQGTITLNDLAQKLNVNQNKLKNRLKLMEHLGYIEAIPNSYCNIDSACSNCPVYTMGCDDDKKLRANSTIYCLTKKGRKVRDS